MLKEKNIIKILTEQNEDFHQSPNSENIILGFLLTRKKIKPGTTFTTKKIYASDQILLEYCKKNMGGEYVYFFNNGLQKIVIACDKIILSEFIKYEKIIFSSLKASGEQHKYYGRLLGYPKCCIFGSNKIDMKIQNPFGYHLSKKSPWPYQLCTFTSNIFHIPCGASCEKSIKMGEEITTIKQELWGITESEMRQRNSGYVLHFGKNIYIFFQADKHGGRLEITKIIQTYDKPHIEATDLSKDFKLQSDFISKITRKCHLEVNDEKIRLIQVDTKKEIIYKKRDPSDGCLIFYI